MKKKSLQKLMVPIKLIEIIGPECERNTKIILILLDAVS